MSIFRRKKIRTTIKAAFPAIVLTGVGISVGHQLIMILAGVGMTLEHRINYGRWWDKDKIICHGKFGIALLMAGCCVTLIGLIGIL